MNDVVAAGSASVRHLVKLCHVDARRSDRPEWDTVVRLPRAIARQVLEQLGIDPSAPNPDVKALDLDLPAGVTSSSSYSVFMCTHLEVMKLDRLCDTVEAVLNVLESVKLCEGAGAVSHVLGSSAVSGTTRTPRVGDVIPSRHRESSGVGVHGTAVSSGLGHVCRPLSPLALAVAHHGAAATQGGTDLGPSRAVPVVPPAAADSDLIARASFCTYWLSGSASDTVRARHGHGASAAAVTSSANVPGNMKRCWACAEVKKALDGRYRRANLKSKLPSQSSLVSRDEASSPSHGGNLTVKVNHDGPGSQGVRVRSSHSGRVATGTGSALAVALELDALKDSVRPLWFPKAAAIVERADSVDPAGRSALRDQVGSPGPGSSESPSPVGGPESAAVQLEVPASQVPSSSLSKVLPSPSQAAPVNRPSVTPSQSRAGSHRGSASGVTGKTGINTAAPPAAVPASVNNIGARRLQCDSDIAALEKEIVLLEVRP